MTDYGHDLRFGTFITPGNAHPEVPVALAQLSDLSIALGRREPHCINTCALSDVPLVSFAPGEVFFLHLHYALRHADP